MKAVVVELDYKGEYERYALTLEDFEEYLVKIHGIPKARREGISRTLKPMVHLWYKEVDVGSFFWNAFMSDMTLDLPSSDIESGNLAYVNFDKFSKEIVDYMKV